MLTDDFILYITGVKRYSDRTREIYADVLRNFCDFACGLDETDRETALTRTLTPTGIRNYEVHLMDGQKLGARTVAQHISVLSSFCRYLMSRGLLASNPARLVKRPKCEKRLPNFFRKDSMDVYFNASEPSVDTESLTEFEKCAEALRDGTPRTSSAYKAAEELYNRRLRRLIISILYETGMRRAELISLKIGSVDFSRKIIRFTGKGDKMREIPAVDALIQEISLYLNVADMAVGRKRGAEEPLLITVNGQKLYPVFVDRAVKRELGDVEGITGKKSPHVLRHTLATELLDDGTDLYSIKELLGHSSLAATQVYTHNTVEKLKKVYANAHPRAKRGGKHGD